MSTAVVSAKRFAHFIAKASKNASECVAKARVCERSEKVFSRLEVLGEFVEAVVDVLMLSTVFSV
jgi:uncharacterized protein (DUF2342 family)